MSLTGRFRHRRSFRGKLVLEVEEVKAGWLRRVPKAHWRDAQLLDLAAPELRPLIDVGKRMPATRPERASAAAAQAQPRGTPAGGSAERRDADPLRIH